MKSGGMMYKRLLYLILFLMAIPSPHVFGQSDEYMDFDRYFLCDARAKAMGNTEILGVVGANALFANPANMFESDQIQFSIGGGIYSGDENSSLYKKNYERYTSDYPAVYRFNSLSAVLPILIEKQNFITTIGIAYHVEKNMNQKYEYSYRYPVWEDVHNYEDFESRHTGGLKFLSPGFSVSMANGISLGMSYHRTVSSNFKNARSTKNITYFQETFPDIYSNDSDAEINFESSYFTIGMVYNKNPIAFGMMIKTAHEIEYKDIIHRRNGVEIWNPDNLTYKEPVQYGFSLGYNIPDKIFLIYELQTRKFSEVEVDGYKEDVEDEYTHKLGAEYHVLNLLALRAGAFIDYIPSYSGTFSSNTEEVICWTTGIGLNFSRITLDISFESLGYSRPTSNYGISGSNDYKFRFIDCSLTYYFNN